MGSCQQRIWYLSVLLTLAIGSSVTLAVPVVEPDAEPKLRQHLNEPQLLVIKEDVIPDVENTTQKVIRVNPLDLPSIQDDPNNSEDSSLYNIQSLLPRNYVNSQHMRKRRPQQPDIADSPIVQYPLAAEQKVQKPKKKKLHFLYNQNDLAGTPVTKRMRVHIAPGAYPVYYAVSKSNGRFGKFPIKGFRNEADFLKYLVKSKVDPIELAKRYEN